jgi:uncharacterized protein YutD
VQYIWIFCAFEICTVYALKKKKKKKKKKKEEEEEEEGKTLSFFNMHINLYQKIKARTNFASK